MNISLNHPLLKSLVSTKKMVRLQHIDMAGPVRYFGPNPTRPYSRYEHSLGVCALLQQHDAPLIEQVAGLLHDISHTALSHVGDLVFDHDHTSGKSYQDSIHIKHLEEDEIADLLKTHNINPKELIPNAQHFPCLEQDLPDLCADRIEYTLRNSLDAQLLTKESFHFLLSELRFKKGKWYFESIDSAKIMGKISLTLCEEFWGSENNGIIYHLIAQSLKKALEHQLLTPDELIFGDDHIVLARLKMAAQEVPEIKNGIIACDNPKKFLQRIEYGQEKRITLKQKFRGIDPLVLHNNQIQRLSYWDTDFAKTLSQIKGAIL